MSDTKAKEWRMMHSRCEWAVQRAEPRARSRTQTDEGKRRDTWQEPVSTRSRRQGRKRNPAERQNTSKAADGRTACAIRQAKRNKCAEPNSDSRSRVTAESAQPKDLCKCNLTHVKRCSRPAPKRPQERLERWRQQVRQASRSKHRKADATPPV